jgi:amidase/6-aminohexanoate-cyclic-dimer hydrolase
LRIALMLTPPSGSPVDAECIAATQATARLLESLGHHVEEARAKIDAEALGRASFAVISTSLAADIDDRAKITGIAPSPEILEKVTLMFYGIGKKTDGMSVARAHTVFQQAAYDLAVFMQNYDIILSPTVAAPPPKTGILGLSPEDIQKWSMQIGQFTPFASVFNMTGQPSMSLPLGMSASGLPIGVMMSGRYGAEATLLRLAGQVEKAAPWWNKMSLPLRSQPSSKQM